MHYLSTILFSFVAIVLGSKILSDEATVAELVSLSTTESQGNTWDTLPINHGLPADNHSGFLQRPSIYPKPYSRIYRDEHSTQWIFGNDTNLSNVSISNCLRMSNPVGVYQFENGSTIYDATLGDIITDLGIGTSRGTRERLAARTMSNALLTHDDLQAFLVENILIKGNSPGLHAPGQFESNGRILALVMKTTVGVIFGVATTEIGNSGEATGGQLAAGIVAGGGALLVYCIIDILREEGALTSLEPARLQTTAIWIANLIMALFRKMAILARARGARDHGGRRYTESDLREQLDRMDVLSAWDAGTTPGTVSSFDIEGFQCDDSPV